MNLCRGHANLLCPVPILVYGLPKWALHVNYFIPTAAQCWRSSSHPRWGQGACLCVKSVWHWSRLAWPPHPCSSLCLPPEARKNLSPRERVSDGEANKGRYFGYKEQHVQNHGDESGKSWRLCLVGALNAFGRMLREETRVGGGDETESWLWTYILLYVLYNV